LSELAETVTQLDIEEWGGKRESNRNSNFRRKEGTARAVRVFKKALDASMAHFLWLANVFL
jgi:hypothetical protein